MKFAYFTFALSLCLFSCSNSEPGERPSQLIRVDVDSFPATNSGQSWDPNDGPDLQLIIIANNQDTVFRSNPKLYQNSITGPYIFHIDSGFNYIPYTESFSVQLLDIDPMNFYQVIDSTVTPFPYPLFYPFCEKYREISIWKFLVVEQ